MWFVRRRTQNQILRLCLWSRAETLVAEKKEPGICMIYHKPSVGRKPLAWRYLVRCQTLNLPFKIVKSVERSKPTADLPAARTSEPACRARTPSHARDAPAVWAAPGARMTPPESVTGAPVTVEGAQRTERKRFTFVCVDSLLVGGTRWRRVHGWCFKAAPPPLHMQQLLASCRMTTKTNRPVDGMYVLVVASLHTQGRQRRNSIMYVCCRHAEITLFWAAQKEGGEKVIE